MESGYPAKRNLVPTWVGGLGRRLFEPIDIAPLVLFRVIFGGVMIWEVYRYFSYGWIARYFIEPTFFFKYYGFGWVRPFAGDGMYVHFAALGVLGACILLGFCYRIAAALFFLGITYVFLLDQTNYLNHQYLICILSFIMIFVPAHRALSLDAVLRPRLRSSTAPAWALWLLRFQIAIPYFFGAIAKFNADWLLAAQPMRMWLAERTDFPVIGHWFTEPWAAYFMSWGGFLFDLLFIPLLLWRRTRPFAFAFAFAFHLMNYRLFHIGVFPWLMLVASVIFLPPETLGRMLRPVLRPRPGSPAASGAPAPAIAIGRREGAILFALALYAAVQILVPFRHLLYPGPVSWTEEGHNFSWHMKLRDKDAKVRIFVTNLDDGSTRRVRLEDYLSPRQARKMRTRPDLILQFAHHLDALERAAGRPNVAVRAHVLVSLNDRPPRLLIDPRVDLSREPRSFGPRPFIRPLALTH
ncbi:MAG TPA: HTTM domain-containing protein [Haliangium sp.]|nr:HTTM domain-containing protein [Haliangium sp.]